MHEGRKIKNEMQRGYRHSEGYAEIKKKKKR